jgi:hypothetical protein
LLADYKYTIFHVMSIRYEPYTITKYEIIWIVVILVAIAILLYVNCKPSYSVGTLYLGENQERICDGRLKKIPGVYAQDMFEFHCTDGRVIQNLANFIVR